MFPHVSLTQWIQNLALIELKYQSGGKLIIIIQNENWPGWQCGSYFMFHVSGYNSKQVKYSGRSDTTAHIAEFIVGRIKSKYFSLNRGLYGDKFIVIAITGPRCLDINNSHNKIVLIRHILWLFPILWYSIYTAECRGTNLCTVAVLMKIFLLLSVLTGPSVTAVVALQVVVISGVTIVLVWVALVGVSVHHL